MAVLWRCAVLSLVVAFSYRPFSMEQPTGSLGWWEEVLFPFTSLIWWGDWFGVKSLAMLFGVALLASWLTAHWALRPEAGGSGSARDWLRKAKGGVRRQGGGRQVAGILWRSALVSLVVALIAPAITMPLEAAGLEGRPVATFPDSAGGRAQLGFEPFEHWWGPYVYPFQRPDMGHWWIQASQTLFLLGSIASVGAVAWLSRSRLPRGPDGPEQ